MNSGKPSLFLHIGVHRTGTTSIQSYLEANKAALSERGVMLPFGLGRPYRYSKRIRNETTSAAEVGMEIFQDLRSRQSRIKSVVFSEEDICQSDNPALFAGLSDQFDVKVVLFLRRQDEWLESWYQQNIKNQWEPELAHIRFDDFLRLAEMNRFFWIDYQSLVNNWAKVFGRDKLILRVMERSRMPDGPVQAFLAAIGCEDVYDPQRDKHRNASLSPQVSELLRHLPMKKYRGLKIRHRVIRAADRISSSMVDSGASILSPELRQEILGWYEEGNQRLAREFFDREQLFDLDVSKPYISWPELHSDEAKALIEDLVDPLLVELAQEAKSWREKAAAGSGSPELSKSGHLKAFVKLLLKSGGGR